MAAPNLPPPLRDGDRLTRDEFLRRWEEMPDLKRAELIDGVVYMPSPVSDFHDDFHTRMSFWLTSYAASTPSCRSGITGTWLMSPDSAPQPDLTLRLRPERGGQSRIEGKYAAGAPELIVEISHTTAAKDKGVKLRLYERSGVREYITVMPHEQEIVWRELVNGSYREIALDADGLFRSRVFPGLWLDPAALWAGDLAGLADAVQRGVAQR
ncbi:MAG TPA: Uma2 family endonuclease [Verrucomicrobiae bacterium]|nr:Uma2 family endonuclease [Verrucomicrobiae bacterium]